MKKMHILISVILASSLIGGCMVGPNYHRPAVQTPTAYRNLSENPQVQAQVASYADLPWCGGKSSRTRNYKNSSAQP